MSFSLRPPPHALYPHSDKSIPAAMPDRPRKALTTGEFDFLGQLLTGEPQIRGKAAALPYVTNFA